MMSHRPVIPSNRPNGKGLATAFSQKVRAFEGPQRVSSDRRQRPACDLQELIFLKDMGSY